MPSFEMRQSSGRTIAVGLAVLTALLASSCSGRAKVTGRVTFNGKPLPAGRITFVSADGKASDPAEISDGAYQVHNAPIGECKIKVETGYLMTMMKAMPGMGGMPGMGNMGQPDMGKSGTKMPDDKKGMMTKNVTEDMAGMKDKIADYLVIIPEDYAILEKTPLTFTVKSGSNTYDVPLTGPERTLPQQKK